jgi:hypothetical protein
MAACTNTASTISKLHQQQKQKEQIFTFLQRTPLLLLEGGAATTTHFEEQLVRRNKEAFSPESKSNSGYVQAFSSLVL